MKQTKTNTIHTNINTKLTTKKIINWSKYDKSLEQRGNFTVLLNVAYLNHVPLRTNKAGHPYEYSDAIILFLAQIREFMQLPIRQTIGMAKFIFAQAGLELKLPSRTTLSRRLAKLNIPTYLDRINFSSPIIFLPDSTGLKISGEGEWKVKKHGADKRREWAKVHLGVDYTRQVIVATSITGAYSHDGKELDKLLEQIPNEIILDSIIADGAYSAQESHAIARKHSATLISPPPTNAVWRGDIKNGNLVDESGWEARNSYVRGCMRLGKEEWKRQMGYHRRSLAETAMSRLKRTFGARLKSRTIRNQIAELNIRVSLLNLFTSYGLPKYVT